MNRKTLHYNQFFITECTKQVSYFLSFTVRFENFFIENIPLLIHTPMLQISTTYDLVSF